MTFASEFNPDDDIAELMGLRPTQPEPVEPQVEEGEEDTRSLFERDLDDFKVMVVSWEQAMESQMVATRAEIPDDYHMITNHKFSPYEQFLANDMELKRRGASYILCREAFSQDTDTRRQELVALYTNDAPLFYDHIGQHYPEGELASAIEDGYVSAENLAGAESGLPDVNRGIAWAQSQGIAESAFMTSFLLSSLETEKMKPETKRLFEKLDTSSRELYEVLAGEVDEDGHRKFVPLSIEQFAGLATAPLYQAFISNPELNVKYGLTTPFQPIEPEVI